MFRTVECKREKGYRSPTVRERAVRDDDKQSVFKVIDGPVPMFPQYEEASVPINADVNSIGLISKTTSGFAWTFVQAFMMELPLVISPWHCLIVIKLSLGGYIERNQHRVSQTITGRSDVAKKVIQVQSDNFRDLLNGFLAQLKADSPAEFVKTDPHFASVPDPVAAIVSQICTMDTLNPFYTYVGGVRCGIPRYVVQGSPEDWELLITWVKTLRAIDESTPQYTGWITALVNTLEHIHRCDYVNDREFWHRSVGYSIADRCGAQPHIAGWILSFFVNDYNKSYVTEFPADFAAVDIEVPNYMILPNGKELPGPTIMKLMAGFNGIGQYPANCENAAYNHALVPSTSWAIMSEKCKCWAIFPTHEQNGFAVLQCWVKPGPDVLRRGPFSSINEMLAYINRIYKSPKAPIQRCQQSKSQFTEWDMISDVEPELNGKMMGYLIEDA